MNRAILIFLSFFFYASQIHAQTIKSIPAQRTNSSIKIDGNIDEAAWKEAAPIVGFVEFRPNAGQPEDTANKTVVYMLYDNTSVYIGGYCYERNIDSISKELVGRDVVGANDFIGVVLDTYNDKINAVGFYVTPYGEQYDAKYGSGPNGEDGSWNSVWDSEAKIHKNGWSFEIRIPYSALRFTNKPNQSWGLNIIRRRNKTGQQFMWNPVDPKVNGFINQEGLWTGLDKIESPLRLSFSPYLSAYVNHYPNQTKGVKDWTASVNGGMDLKYGISEAFTLDMTLIPDFGQVQSDNQVLNLSPFEVKYNENRSFFTEGTELFNKGDLFYSRRIGGTPLHYYDVQDTSSSFSHIRGDERFLRNPQESKLINATKISGRTAGGLGIGFFNAITRPMYAQVEDAVGNTRKIETAPLTNFNILVLDQNLKNHSSVSLINTNVLRSGTDYDANVTAAVFNINNKKNSYNWTGKFSMSQLNYANQPSIQGYSHSIAFGKTNGRWNYLLGQDLADEHYDINDMGILFNNNYINHSFWTGYKWVKPGKWYNNMQVNYNANFNSLLHAFPGQLLNTKFKSFNTNINANAQLKNLWFIGVYLGYVPQGHDFYEPHQDGYSFIGTSRKQFSTWFETNQAKKYYVNFNYFVGLRDMFNSLNQEFSITQQYRFSDKLSINYSFYFNPVNDDAGFYSKFYDGTGNLKDIIFSRRDRKTVENIFKAKYNFNNRSGFSIRMRHYWSNVYPQQLYDLQVDGSLKPTIHPLQLENQNFNIFNVDAIYTWQFAPGSFLNIVWKQEGLEQDGELPYTYLKNIDKTLAKPKNNNVSIKMIYYFDYLSLRKKKAVK